MPKIGVMGAGAIGCFVGGKLATSNDVVFVGRERLKREVQEHGLTLEDLGQPTVKIPSVGFTTDAHALADRDVILICVKSGATAATAEQLSTIIRKDACVVSLQNGVRNPDQLRAHLPERTILPGIVNFNVLSKGKGVFRRATSGPVIIERANDDLDKAFADSHLELERPESMNALQWSKLLINLNNAISALSDAPTKDLVLNAGYRKILSALITESLAVLTQANIRPAKLGAVPIHLLAKALRLPTPIVRLVARAQLKIDPEARSSMWEDLTSNRPTEVDFLNGEVVRLAESCGAKAPLNRRIVEIVHEAERAKQGSPKLSPDELWTRLTAP